MKKKKHPSRNGWVLEFENGHVWSIVDLANLFGKKTPKEYIKLAKKMFPLSYIEALRVDKMSDQEMIRGKSFAEVIKLVKKYEND